MNLEPSLMVILTKFFFAVTVVNNLSRGGGAFSYNYLVSLACRPERARAAFA